MNIDKRAALHLNFALAHAERCHIHDTKLRVEPSMLPLSVTLVSISKSYYNSGNLCRGFVDRGWTVKFDFQENRSHDSLQTRPMCCPEPDDVPFIFESVQMLSTYRIKWLFSGVLCAMLLSAIGNSPDGSAICCLIGGRQPKDETVNNRRKIGQTILTLPSVIILSAVSIAQNWYFADSLLSY